MEPENRSQPNWVDKANLASNVMQNVQLQGVQSTLQAIGALQAEKVKLELREQQTREQEDKLRDGIWQMEQMFENVLQDPTATPLSTYFVAKYLLGGMTNNALTTASFRQFADKDRLGKFTAKLQRTVKDLQNELTPQQEADIGKFLRYEAEDRDLTALIEELRGKHTWVKNAEERRATLMITVADQQMELEQPKRWCGFSILTVIIVWLVVVSLLFILAFGSSSYNDRTGVGVMCLIIGSIITGGLLWFCGKTRHATIGEQTARRTQEIDQLDAQIAKEKHALELKIAPVFLDADRSAGLGVVTGDRANRKVGLPELITWKQDRDAFMTRFKLACGFKQEPQFTGIQNVSQTTNELVDELAVHVRNHFNDRKAATEYVINWASENKDRLTVEKYNELNSLSGAIRFVKTLSCW